MANSASARKRARQAENRRIRNKSYMSRFRTYVKKVNHAIDAKDAPAAQAAYKEAVTVIAKTAGKGLIHKNKAARLTSRLNARIKEMAA